MYKYTLKSNAHNFHITHVHKGVQIGGGCGDQASLGQSSNI